MSESSMAVASSQAIVSEDGSRYTIILAAGHRNQREFSSRIKTQSLEETCWTQAAGLTGQSLGDGAGVSAQVLLVEALGVTVPKQPRDLLLQHRPHRLGQGAALAHWRDRGRGTHNTAYCR